MIYFIVWVVGVIVCFELMFHVFERATVGFSTKDLYFAFAAAILALIWPVYVPWTLIRRVVNTRKLKTR